MVRTSNLAPSNNTDALFRAWINEIHNSLIAFGWLQTADTGQINFATVTRPAGTNTYQGFAVYKMGDALQSTCAVYLRFDFGTGGSADDPAIKFQMGVGGTDGAGNLTGNISVITTTSPASVSASATPAACRCSGTSSAFRMCFWTAAGIGFGRGWFFAIERDKDTTGVDNTLGVGFAYAFTQNNVGTAYSTGSCFLETKGGNALDTTRLYAMVTASATQTTDSITGVGPVRVAFGRVRNPMTGLLVFARLDFVNESQNLVALYGSSHNYLMLRLGPNTASVNSWNNDCGLALLWE